MAVGTYALTSLANLKSWLGITASTDDAVLERAIDRATARIESHLGRQILSRSYSEWRNGCGVTSIHLNQWPVTQVTNVWTGNRAAIVIGATSGYIRASVSVNQETDTPALVTTTTTDAGVTVATTHDFDTLKTTADVVTSGILTVPGYTASLSYNTRSVQLRPRAGADAVLATVTLFAADTASEYTYDYDRGILSIDPSSFAYWPMDAGVMPDAVKSVLVEYTAGYDTVPDDIEQACIEIAALMYRDRKRDGNIASESLGDYSYTRASRAEIAGLMSSLLDNYRELA